jgi:hypothetical protein
MKNIHKINENIYITSDEEIKEGDWCLDKFNQRWKLEDEKLIAFDSKGIKRFSTDNILGHECKKIILTTDQDLINDGVQAIDDTFLEWFVKNPSCEEVDLIGLRKEGDNYEFLGYEIIIPSEECKRIEEPKKETLEEAAERLIKLNRQDAFYEGAKWQQERMYSEEEVFVLLNAFNKHTLKLQSLKLGNSFDVKEWFEQFKKK